MSRNDLLEFEQDRARRIREQLQDPQSQQALAAYISELESEQLRARAAAPPVNIVRI